VKAHTVHRSNAKSPTHRGARSLTNEQLERVTGGYGTNGDIHVVTPPVQAPPPTTP
jgi:hypothetical protein